MGNLEWYDPATITTKGGTLKITLSKREAHNLNYEDGMITSWNQFCFTEGYIEIAVTFPGLNEVTGLWPAIWAMGNLGRAGYGVSLSMVLAWREWCVYRSTRVGSHARLTDHL